MHKMKWRGATGQEFICELFSGSAAGTYRFLSNPHHPRIESGGRGGIRTHGGFNPTLDFESSALNRTRPPFLRVNLWPVIEAATAAFAMRNASGERGQNWSQIAAQKVSRAARY